MFESVMVQPGDRNHITVTLTDNSDPTGGEVNST